MEVYAKVIKEFKIPGARELTVVGQRLDVRHTEYGNYEDNAQVYKGNTFICDIPSQFSDMYLEIVTERTPKELVTTRQSKQKTKT